MSSSTNAMSSLYIPTVKSSYSVEKIVFLLWKHGLGKVDRVDFAPIIRANDKECPNFKQAFLYVDPMSAWHPDIVKSIEDGTPYKIYPNKDETFDHLRDEKEYWLILKNKSPVPYATTTLNVHQLANNLALLEALFAEREAEFAHQKALISELQEVNNRLSDFNRDRSVDDDENTEEMKAYNLFTSFDNVLRMMEQDDDYGEYSLSDRFNNDEDDLDNDYEECIVCHQDKSLEEFVPSFTGDNVCKDCANLCEMEISESY